MMIQPLTSPVLQATEYAVSVKQTPHVQGSMSIALPLHIERLPVRYSVKNASIELKLTSDEDP
jgi:hypothetical protein